MPRIMVNLFNVLFLTGTFFAAFALQSAPAKADPKDEAEALGLVSAIDKNEIAAAQKAEQKNVDPKVLDYAKMLEKDHSENLNEAAAISQKTGVAAAQDAKIQALQSKGAQDLASLSSLDGDPFARAYLAAMVNGHAQALDTIQNQIKISDDKEVKAFLDKTSTVVAKHLEEAQKLQTSLGS